jgi:uncharacterized SAM-binding protein YcdF (DUF218 family)
MNNSSQATTRPENAGVAATDENRSSSAGRPACNCWGLVTHRPRWGLSWRGWLVLLAVTCVIATLFVLWIHPFLCVTRRTDTNILVVEGWIEAYAIRGGAAEFNTGSYERLFTTGGPIVGDGGYSTDNRTSAGVGAEELKRAGVPAHFVQVVASHEIGRDRTYQSAVALRNWFHQHNLSVHSFNLVTADCHGRRSRLLYQMAFGDDVQIGIVSISNTDYDPTRWWRYSEGVREILSESVSYLYARLIFHPAPP